MACDICGRTGIPLVDIRVEYQTPTIVSICSHCNKLVSDHMSEVKGEHSKLLQESTKLFMQSIRPPAPPGLAYINEPSSVCEYCGHKLRRTWLIFGEYQCTNLICQLNQLKGCNAPMPPCKPPKDD